MRICPEKGKRPLNDRTPPFIICQSHHNRPYHDYKLSENKGGQQASCIFRYLQLDIAPSCKRLGEISGYDEKHRHVERSDAPAQNRMIPTEEMGGDHQQDTDALHDVEGPVALGYVSGTGHFNLFLMLLNHV